MVTTVKTWVWEEFLETMEQDFESALKKFYQTVQSLSRGKLNPVHMVFSVGEELLTLTEHAV